MAHLMIAHILKITYNTIYKDTGLDLLLLDEYLMVRGFFCFIKISLKKIDKVIDKENHYC